MSLPGRCRRLSAPCALLVFALLSGCRSESAPANEPALPAQTAPAAAAPGSTAQTTNAADKRPVIVAFGDSLTAGFGADPGQSYPDYLQTDLEQQGFHYRVVNAGVSGNTTKDGLNRLPDVLDFHPYLVIVEFGGNDGLRGWPIETTRKNMNTIVATLQQSGAKVVLGGITLPPNYGPEYVHQFNETYTLLSRKYHVPLLPFLLIHVYGTPGSMQPDGIHATAQGNAQVARNLLPLVSPLLTRQ